VCSGAGVPAGAACFPVETSPSGSVKRVTMRESAAGNAVAVSGEICCVTRPGSCLRISPSPPSGPKSPLSRLSRLVIALGGPGVGCPLKNSF